MLFPSTAGLALLFLGAHCLRAGFPTRAAVCVLLALLAWTRRAWVRVALPILLFAAAYWIRTASLLTQWRIALHQPWLRMAAILLGMAAFSLLAALAATSRGAKLRYTRTRPAAPAQATCFLVVFGALAAMSVNAPHLLLADRLYPGLGAVQALVLGLWAAWAAGALADVRRARVRGPGLRHSARPDGAAPFIRQPSHRSTRLLSGRLPAGRVDPTAGSVFAMARPPHLRLHGMWGLRPHLPLRRPGRVGTARPCLCAVPGLSVRLLSRRAGVAGPWTDARYGADPVRHHGCHAPQPGSGRGPCLLFPEAP